MWVKRSSKVACAVAGLLVMNAVAEDYVWQGGDGSFSDPLKWSISGVPGVADRVFFNTPDQDGTVTWAASVTNSEMTVGTVAGHTLSLNLGGNAYTLTNRFSFEADKAGSYVVVSNGFFTVPTNICEMKINSGVTPARLTFGEGAVASLYGLKTWRSEVNIGTGAVVTLNGDIRIGDAQANALSTLTVNGGCLTNNYWLWINTGGANSTSVLNLVSGSILAKNYFSISDQGNGSSWGIFNMSGGTLENQYAIWMGNSGGARAVMNMSGGRWLSKDNFELAHAGKTTAWLNMTGGEIVLPVASKNFFVANNVPNGHNTTGMLSVTGGRIAVTNTGSSLIIGNASNCLGQCTLGGTGEVVAANVLVANYPTSRGECLVTGGTMTISTSLLVGNAAAGDGRLRIGGGAVTGLNNITVGNAALATGTVEVAGGTLAVNNALSVGSPALSAGTLIQTGGCSVVKGLTYVGDSGSGCLEVSGGELHLSNTVYFGSAAKGVGAFRQTGGTFVKGGASYTYVGYSGTGTFEVAGGTAIFSNNTYSLSCGYNAGSLGTLTSSGGKTTVAGYTDIGRAGLGLFEMKGGEWTTTFLRMNPGAPTTPMPPQSEIRMTGGRLVVGDAMYAPDTASITGRITLAGGVFAVKAFRQHWGKLHVLFDGGTIEVMASTPTFIRELDWYALTGNGLVVDTAGFNAGTALPLPDAEGEHGRFVKKGAGIFTLAAANTFTGPVVVEAGELALSSVGLVTLAGGCEVDGGALLNLSARSLDFTLPSGTVSRVDGELRLASGKTLTVTNGATLGGTGTVGRVTFVSGATLARSASSGDEVLHASECVIPAGATIALSGYTVEELWQGITVLSGGTLSVAQSGSVSVLLNGQRQPSVALRVSGGTLTVQRVNPGTMVTLH